MITQSAPLMFGVGCLKSLGDQMKRHGLKKALIVTDKGITAAGVTEKVAAVIKDAGGEYVIYDECLPDPPHTSIPKPAAIANEEKVDFIIGLGGGSCMDTAKAASVVIKNPKPATEFIMKPPAQPDVPVILIPTTSGTGSEVTSVGVISDADTFEKFGVVITGALLAIVDPELTVGLPPHITAMTGMDVVAHAVEAITGKMRNPMSDLRGYEALRLVAENLPSAVRDGSNIQAREGMSFASTLAGMAFNDSITTLGHSISQALSKTTHLPHGLLCGLATPPEVALFATVLPEKVKKIGLIFGADIPEDATPEEIGKLSADKIREFMSEVGLSSFEKLGYSREDILGKIEDVMADRMKVFSPLEITREIAIQVLNEMCDYKG